MLPERQQEVLLLVLRDHDVHYLLKQLVSVSFTAVRALVWWLVSTRGDELAFDAIRDYLGPDVCIAEHSVTVDVDKHRALATLNHLLPVYHLDTNDFSRYVTL